MPLRHLLDELEALEAWTVEHIHHAFNAVMAHHTLALGKIAQPVRVALTGGTVSPGIFEVIDVLGKERTLERLRRALTRLTNAPTTA